jgi:hypothetical protein
MVKLKVKVLTLGAMEQFIKVIFIKVKSKAEENGEVQEIRYVILMKVIGTRTEKMVRVLLFGRVEILTQARIKMMKEMALVR